MVKYFNDTFEFFLCVQFFNNNSLEFYNKYFNDLFKFINSVKYFNDTFEFFLCVQFFNNNSLKFDFFNYYVFKKLIELCFFH